MPVRVELIDEAVEDLAAYLETDIFPHLLAKLVRLEEVGQAAGYPLGKDLTGWRKIIVGDRAWRIIFSTNAGETVATVWVIGDRDDSACYETARQRVQALPKGQTQAASLVAVMYQLIQRQRAAKRQSRGKKR
jgi:mRNA interferase RelE/StbE